MSRSLSELAVEKIELQQIRNFPLYGFIYFVWLFGTIVFNSTALVPSFEEAADIVYKILSFSAVTCLAVVSLMQKYSRRQLVIAAIYIVVFGFSWLVSGWRFLLVSTLFIVTAQHIDLRSVARLTFYAVLLGMLCVFMLVFLGVAENLVLYRGDSPRYSMGFYNQNTFGVLIFELITSYVLFRWSRMNKCDALIVLVTLILGFRLCGSRSLLLAGLILLALLFVLKVLFPDKHIPTQSAWLVVACCAGSILFAVLYSDGVWGWLDDLMSTRLSQMNNFWKCYGFSVVGQSVPYAEATYVGPLKLNVIDNAYGHIAILFGIVPLVLFVLAYYCVMRKAASEKCDIVAIILIAYCVLGLFETGIYRVSFSYILIAISYVLFDKSFVYLDEDVPTNHEE